MAFRKDRPTRQVTLAQTSTTLCPDLRTLKLGLCLECLMMDRDDTHECNENGE